MLKTGDSYNRLKVLKHAGAEWECQCKCGNLTFANANELLSGKKKSCGCLKYVTGSGNPLWNGTKGISGKYWYRLLKSATSRDIGFEITREFAWELYASQNGKCALTNMDIRFPESSKDCSSGNWTASLDRIDSARPYVEGNVWWVHKHLNLMKLTFDIDYFIQLCRMVVDKEEEIKKTAQQLQAVVSIAA